jgi:hypothetical protein
MESGKMDLSKKIETLNDIDSDSHLGKILIATLSQLSCQPEYSDKHPNAILKEMVQIADSFI